MKVAASRSGRIDHPSRLHVDQDGAVAPALAEGELVDAEHPRCPLGHRRGGQQPQEVGAAGGKLQGLAQPLAGAPAEERRDRTASTAADRRCGDGSVR